MRTVTPSWHGIHETRRQYFSPSPLLRAEALRADAARVMRDVFQQGAKRYPLLSPQKLSEARNRGGSLGEVAVMMLAEPAAAHRMAEWLAVTARMVNGQADTRPLPVVLMSEADASREKDAARERAQADPSPENLRRYLRALVIAQAETQKTIDAIRLALEMEGGT
jgi:hypothetical protein